MKADRPYEGWYSLGYTTVLKDGAKYRMYYRGMPNGVSDGSVEETTCYAESDDGIHWTKPNLGLFEVNGNKQNNVILAKMPPFSHNFAPIIDTIAQMQALGRYQGIVAVEPFDYVPYGLGCAAHSIGYLKGIVEGLAAHD